MFTLLVNVVVRILAYSLVVALVFWACFQWKKWDFLQAARKLPCTMKALPLLGHSLICLQGWEGFTKEFLRMSQNAVSKGLYNVCFWCGPLPLVMIHKLEDVQKVLNSSATAEKGDEYTYFEYVGKDSLITARGHIWKLTRRHINPLFHSINIEQLMTVFNDNSRELVAELSEHVATDVEMLHLTMRTALKTVCQLIFGTELEFDTKSKEFQGLMKCVELIPDLFVKRVLKPWLRVDFIFDFLYKKEIENINKLWQGFTETPLKKAKENHAIKHGYHSSQNGRKNGIAEKGSINLIDCYEELRNKYPQFTETDMKTEMITLYCTGTDTVALTVATCLLVLGQLQDIQDRLIEEISSVVGPHDDVSVEHIGKLPYMDQVYRETLRWSLIVPYVVRKTTEDLKLSDCTIPAGNSVMACLIGPHMDPKIYPDPEKFNPENFSPKNANCRSKNAFMPFSGGSRMCIGKTYADYLFKTMMVHVLRRYRVSTEMDIYNLNKKLTVTLVNSEGYHITFSDRKM